MGKWEVIFAITFFVVNGVVGYLAKREKEKARRNAELDGLEVSKPKAPRAETRLEPRPQPTSVARRPARPNITKAGGPPKPPAASTSSSRPPSRPLSKPRLPKSPPPPRSPASERETVPPKPTKAALPKPIAALASPTSDRAGDRIRASLRDPAALRSAVLWSEVLGRPRGLEPFGSPGRD